MINLSSIGQPEVIETISFEGVLSDLQADLIGLFPDIAPVLQLESALVNKMMQVASYREIILRARINDAAKGNLLAFASGANLEHLAALYGVERMPGEDDNRLRYRTQVENKGRSPGGSSYWYQAAALRADIRVKSAVVYRDALLPIIYVSVLSYENGGIPDQSLLDAVNSYLQSDLVRLVNDTVIVAAAAQSTTDVEADVWLLPDASVSIVDGLPDYVKSRWSEEAGTGFDLELSWLMSKMHVSGVKKVVIKSPTVSIVATPGVAVALGEIRINFKGYDY